MDGNLRRRQPEDQPTMPGVHVGELQNVLEERAIRVRLAGVEKEVRGCDHVAHVNAEWQMSNAGRQMPNADGWPLGPDRVTVYSAGYVGSADRAGRHRRDARGGVGGDLRDDAGYSGRRSPPAAGWA